MLEGTSEIIFLYILLLKPILLLHIHLLMILLYAMSFHKLYIWRKLLSHLILLQLNLHFRM